MGTHASVKIIGDRNEKDKITSCIKTVFTELSRIEKLFSHYDPESEVSILNKYGLLKKPSKEFLYILDKAQSLYSLSGGVFDITVLPLLEQLNEYSGDVIQGEMFREVRDLIGFNNIEFSEQEISFKKKEMKITLGGIAKGYAIDCAANIIKNMKITNALIEIGGDIKCISDGTFWTIGIRNPFQKDDIISKVNISNRAIATSGNYEKIHIINPKDLILPKIASATVIAKNAIDADALATTAFIMGQDFLELIKKFPDAEALLIMNDGQMIRTNGFRYFEVNP